VNCREGRPAHFSLALFSVDSRARLLLALSVMLPFHSYSVYGVPFP